MPAKWPMRCSASSRRRTHEGATVRHETGAPRVLALGGRLRRGGAVAAVGRGAVDRIAGLPRRSRPAARTAASRARPRLRHRPCQRAPAAALAEGGDRLARPRPADAAAGARGVEAGLALAVQPVRARAGAGLRGRAPAAAGRRQHRRDLLQPVPAVGGRPRRGAQRLPPRAQAAGPAAVLHLRPGNAVGAARRVRAGRSFARLRTGCTAARQPVRGHRRHRRCAGQRRLLPAGGGSRRGGHAVSRHAGADAGIARAGRDQCAGLASRHVDRARAFFRRCRRVRGASRRSGPAGDLGNHQRDGLGAGSRHPDPRARRRRGRGAGVAHPDPPAFVSAQRHVLLAVALSLLAALLFTSTYVLNRAVALDGGHWAWTASLRFLFMLPLLLPLMPWQGGIAPVWRSIRAAPAAWLGWSGLGFVVFYALLCYAASSGPAWLVAGSFQVMVVAGMLCAPLLYRVQRARIPRAGLAVGLAIVAGMFLMQVGHAQGALDARAWIALGCMLV